MLRGRTIWVAWTFAALPVVFTIVVAQAGRARDWGDLFGPLVMLAGVLGPLFMASSLAEEIEDRTFTYLWSRPVPRSSIVLGKLMAAAPLSGGILAVTVVVCFLASRGGTPGQLARGVAAAVAGATATCAISAGTSLLLPRAGLAVTYAYLAIDLVIGAIPFSLRNLAVTHQIRQIAGVGSGGGEPVWIAAAWLIGVCAVWLALAFVRVARSEFTSGDR
jgi:ABC-type transport system involved in multi-copper enzyme maturation permease subunit